MDEKSYEEFEAEDFIVNESFLNYHLSKNTEDQIFWEEWLARNPAKLETVREARGMINALLFRLTDSEYQAELDKIKGRIGVDNKESQSKSTLTRYLYSRHPENEKPRRTHRSKYLILPLLVIIALGGYFYLSNSTDRAQPATITENSGRQPMTLFLSDSTKVILASGSRLEYQKQFGSKERNVTLSGEGFFKVTKDSKRPFRVFASGLTATVLGTEFNVRANNGDSLVMVELLEGKVKVEAENVAGSVLLNPSERAVYTRKEGNIYKETWNPGTYATTSKVAHLAFDKNSFEEVAQKFKSVFGITVINNSTNVNWSFTGEFNDVNARDVIENICLLKHLAYEIKGDTIVLR